jgi:hypothetical protein
MALSSGDLQLLTYLRNKREISGAGRVMEIGAQQLSRTFLRSTGEIEELGRLFGISGPYQMVAEGEPDHAPDALLAPDAPRSRDFWRWLGYRYSSIDIDGSADSIPIDLNCDPVPASALGRYDLVVNAGTTEHVANQVNAFKIIHDLAKVDGIMVHNLPSQGMLNHGLINYNPKFFWMLSRSNGYRMVYFSFLSEAQCYPVPDDIVSEMAKFRPDASTAVPHEFRNAAVVVALQKQFDKPFVAPLDVNTGTAATNPELQDRYWSVFDVDAFMPSRTAKAGEGLRMVVGALSPGLGIWRAIRRIVGPLTGWRE